MPRKPNITISYEDLSDIEEQLRKIKLPAERFDGVRPVIPTFNL